MHACVFRHSLCLCAAQTGRNKKERANKAEALVGWCAGRRVSCASLSPLLLSALQPAALSGRLGSRKYASLVLEPAAGFILSVLHVPAQHGSKGRGGGKKEEDKREDGECCVFRI